MIAPSPTEVERLAQLRRYEILDTAPEDVFDDFTVLAAQICGTPISLISLVDAERQWFKSKVGLTESQTPRGRAFCDYAIRTPEVMEVPDATLDHRFVDNPLVTGAPDIRFYAGSPLIAPDGSRIGTLCVIDRVPRHLSDAQRAALARLGRQIIVQLELRLSRRDLEARIAGAARTEALMSETLARANAAERSTVRVNEMLSSVRELLTGHLVQNGRRATFARLLQLLLDYTDSNYGFVAEVLHDPAGQPYLRTQAVTNIAWNDEMRAFFDKHHAAGLEFRNLKTLFGAALTTGQTVISNSPGTDPRRGGLPPGHPPMNSFLGVPIRHGGEMVGMVGVANRPDGYDQALVELLEPLFSAYATIIHDVRMADLREEAQLKIGRLNQELQDRADRLDQANQALAERDQLRQLALENASVRLQHLATMDAASDGLALLDSAGRYTYVNTAHATMFGFSKSEEMLGKEWRILYDDEELSRIGSEVFPELMAKRQWHGRARARRLDGTHFAEALTLTLTPDGGLICVCRDDTVAVESEEKIRALSAGLETRAHELEQLAAHLAEAQRIGNIGSWSLDLTSDTLQCSDQALHIFGQSRQHFDPSQQAFQNALHPEDSERHTKALGDALAKMQPYEVETRIIRPDGTIRWVDFHGQPTPGPDGTATGISGTILDITVRKEKAAELQVAQERVRESNERVRQVVDTALDAVITMDDKGRISAWNRQAEIMFGWSEAEALGQVLGELIVPPALRAAHARGMEHYLTTGENKIFGHRLELTALCRDGREIPVELSVNPIFVDGVRQFSSFLRDISARKKSQNELLQVNRELSDFAHVVSHDLKAPLRAIGSLANWLQQDYAAKLGPEGAEQLQLIGGRVARLSNLIDGILSYSRAGRTQRSQTLVSLDVLVRGTLEMLAPPPHITVAMADALPEIRMDPTKAQQLFQNLLSNAIKYMDKPSGRVTVGCVAAGRFWQFSIADNGPGIEEKYFERIFQLFQTLAPRDEVESTGVGLAVVKKIVETEGGRIWIESVVGHGATFHFTLPRGEPA